MLFLQTRSKPPRKWPTSWNPIQEESHFVQSPSRWRRRQLQLPTTLLHFPLDYLPFDFFAVVEILSQGSLILFSLIRFRYIESIFLLNWIELNFWSGIMKLFPRLIGGFELYRRRKRLSLSDSENTWRLFHLEFISWSRLWIELRTCIR